MFNRAILFNIGFKEAQKFNDYQCFIFHDVDLLPEDDHNMYNCPASPRHMCPAVDKFKYRYTKSCTVHNIMILISADLNQGKCKNISRLG